MKEKDETFKKYKLNETKKIAQFERNSMCHPVKQVHMCKYAWVFIIPFDIIFLSTHQKQKKWFVEQKNNNNICNSNCAV